MKILLSKFLAIEKYYNKKRADDLLRGIYQLGTFEPVETSINDIWNCESISNSNWHWRLHSLDFINELMSAFSNTNNYGYLDCVSLSIESWINNNSIAPYPNRFSWHDHAAALRLINICKFVLHYGYLLKPESKSLLYLSGQQHCHRLSLDYFYNKFTNHGLDQSIALYLGSLTFFSTKDGDDYKAIAKQRIESELDYAFSPDGIHVENSPQYHAIMLLKIRRLLYLLSDDLTLCEKVKNILNRGVNFLVHIIEPDSYIPIIGDSEKKNLSPLFSSFEGVVENFDNLTYVITKGTAGLAPSSNNFISSDAGYAIYRSSWNSPFDESIQLIFKCGYLSNYHRQDDDLNILLYGYGERWFIDSGIYSYSENDPLRLYMRSACAHNVPMPLDLVNCERRCSPYKSELSLIDDIDGIFAVRGFTNLYKSVSIIREINVINELIYINDEIDSDSKVDIRSIFHIPSNKSVNILSDNMVEVVGISGKVLIIECLGSNIKKIDVSSGFLGINPSITSPTYLDLEDSTALVFNCNGSRIRYRLFFKDL